MVCTLIWALVARYTAGKGGSSVRPATGPEHTLELSDGYEVAVTSNTSFILAVYSIDFQSDVYKCDVRIINHV